MVDVAVIGAGLAGLVAAQQLRLMGHDVVVVEKSRGFGGRLATRRLAGTWADHGVRCLEAQGVLSQALIQQLEHQGILTPWTDRVYELTEAGLQPSSDRHPRYSSPTGITAVAKFLATGLEVWRGQRVIAVTPTADRQWSLSLEPAAGEPRLNLTANALVVAIPAPQTLSLLEPLADQGLAASVLMALRSVEFDPCLSAIAVYSAEHQPALTELAWSAILGLQALDISWVGLESSKQPESQRPVCVVQSTAAFANAHLESPDLNLAGYHLLAQAARWLLPWLRSPEELQVHRWRYATVRSPWQAPYLATPVPLPLVCAGDWCGGSRVEDALRSGLAAATQMMGLLSAVPPQSEPDRFVELLQTLERAWLSESTRV